MSGFWTCPDCGTQINTLLINEPVIIEKHNEWHTKVMANRLQLHILETLDRLGVIKGENK